MPRRCSICDSVNREAIDHMLVGRSAPFRAIARQFHVSKDALLRHHDDHLPAVLARAQSARDQASADRILERLLSIHGVTLAILKEARASGNHNTALGAIARAEKQLELQAKLVGQLKDSPTVSVSLTTEFRAVQAAILNVLAPHPQLRVKVADALDRLAIARAN